MHRARSVINTYDTHKSQQDKQYSFGHTSTPLQTIRSPDRGKFFVTLEGIMQPLPTTPQTSSILAPRTQSPAFGHLTAVRKSIREMRVRHPSRSIYHESTTVKEGTNQCDRTQGQLSISDLTTTTRHDLVFDREKVEVLIHQLLDERDNRIKDIATNLLEDVKKEMDYRCECINNIVRLIRLEKKRTQRLSCRSVIANKLLKQVQTKLNDQSAQIIELQSRIGELELQVKELQEQDPQIQHAVNVLIKSEDTVATNIKKIDQQVGSIYDYLQKLQCSLEQFITRHQKEKIDNSTINKSRIAAELSASLNIIYRQLNAFSLMQNPLPNTLRE